jgi:polysaccharide export outer membrane protein
MVLGLLAGCGHVGQFVWVDDYKDPAAPAKDGYVIGQKDLIAVRVWNQESMSARAHVREDGKISLPFLNDVQAAGLEPPELAQQLQAKLKSFVVNPVVTVSLEEQAPVEVSVIGEVTRPGVYRIDRDTGVLEALANAGGLTQIASRDRIFVLRYGADPRQPSRIRFTYRALTQNQGGAAKFRLRSRDLVVVE